MFKFAYSIYYVSVITSYPHFEINLEKCGPANIEEVRLWNPADILERILEGRLKISIIRLH